MVMIPSSSSLSTTTSADTKTTGSDNNTTSRRHGVISLDVEGGSKQHFEDGLKIVGKSNDNGQKCDNSKETTLSLRKRLHVAFHYYFIPILTIIAWYWTNGMNGIAMQTFATSTKKESLFLHTLVLTAVITTIQLFLGAIAGKLTLFTLSILKRRHKSVNCYNVLCNYIYSNNKMETTRTTIPTTTIQNGIQEPMDVQGREGEATQQRQRQHQKVSAMFLIIIFLHAIGSLSTNVGFMYGKASMVQIIKLLEPFETLAWSQIFVTLTKARTTTSTSSSSSSSHSSNACTIGIISSTMLVVGAAISLLPIPKNHANNWQSSSNFPWTSVLCAVVSGLTLTCRNVLQRNYTTSNSMSNIQSFSQLEQSIVVFTELSWFSSIATAVFCMLCQGVIYLLYWNNDSNGAASNVSFLGMALSSIWNNPLIVVWHPLYNECSMMTLGYCSALTHSLLNAGKRVSSILMAMLWFHESITWSTLVGLSCVAIGGTWYTLEKKKSTKSFVASIANSSKKKNDYFECFKIALSLSALLILFYFQVHESTRQNVL